MHARTNRHGRVRCDRSTLRRHVGVTPLRAEPGGTVGQQRRGASARAPPSSHDHLPRHLPASLSNSSIASLTLIPRSRLLCARTTRTLNTPRTLRGGSVRSRDTHTEEGAQQLRTVHREGWSPPDQGRATTIPRAQRRRFERIGSSPASALLCSARVVVIQQHTITRPRNCSLFCFLSYPLLSYCVCTPVGAAPTPMHDDSPSSLPPFSGPLQQQNARSRVSASSGSGAGSGSAENLSLMRGSSSSSASASSAFTTGSQQYIPTTPVYSEKGHTFSSAPGACASGPQRNRWFAALTVATLLACVWLWNHPVHFGAARDAEYNESSGLRPGDLQVLGVEGGNGVGSHSQTMRALSLAALDAGRPAPVGVSYQCPAPQPCPVPLCPTQEASVSASCPKCDTFAGDQQKECPVCEPQRKCPKVEPARECPPVQEPKVDATTCGAFCAAQSDASKGLSLPPYLTPRLQSMQRSAAMLSPAAHDLSTKVFRPSEHEATWEYCEQSRKIKAHTSVTREGLALCPDSAKNEWWWQLKCMGQNKTHTARMNL